MITVILMFEMGPGSRLLLEKALVNQDTSTLIAIETHQLGVSLEESLSPRRQLNLTRDDTRSCLIKTKRNTELLVNASDVEK
jgi:hypothetical protein